MIIQYYKPKNLQFYFLELCGGIIKYFSDGTWNSCCRRRIESTSKLCVYMFVIRDLYTSQTLQQGLNKNTLIQHLAGRYSYIDMYTPNIKIRTLKEAYTSKYVQYVYPYMYKNHYLLFSLCECVIMDSKLDLSNDATLDHSLLIVEVTKD